MFVFEVGITGQSFIQGTKGQELGCIEISHKVYSIMKNVCKNQS
jgi:hypothetical protein